jgi:AraC family transcriptional regulator
VSISARALWYIESHLSNELALDEIAAATGVSRFHLSRAFSLSVAQTISGYVRARRLSDAAVALAAGAESILHVALAAGYGSHEAFTRAFCAQFGATPEQVRARKSTRGLALQEALRMTVPKLSQLEAPRIVRDTPRKLFGLAQRCHGNAGIAALWDRFVPYLGTLPEQLGAVTYGVMFDADESGMNFTYACAVEVRAFPASPKELARIELPARTYAVWPHREHVSSVGATCAAIFSHGLADAKLEPLHEPMFERYDEAFDPRTGNGGLEVWVPVKD